MLDDAALDAIEARANAASPGPWHGDHHEYGCVSIGDFGWVCSGGANSPQYDVDSEQGRADAEFIAHARADVPALVTEVRRLRAERDLMRPDVRAYLRLLEELAAAVGDEAEHDGSLEAVWQLKRQRDEARAQVSSLQEETATARSETDRLREMLAERGRLEEIGDELRDQLQRDGAAWALEQAERRLAAGARQEAAEVVAELAEQIRTGFRRPAAGRGEELRAPDPDR